MRAGIVSFTQLTQQTLGGKERGREQFSPKTYGSEGAVGCQAILLHIDLNCIYSASESFLEGPSIFNRAGIHSQEAL